MQDDFVARATELGAFVHFAGSEDEAVAQIVDIFRPSGSLKVVISPDIGTMEGPVREALERAGAESIPGDTAQALSVADLGVTRAALGVAETGSVVVAGNESVPRLASMLPFIHVVILRSSDLVASLDEAGAYLRRISTDRSDGQIRYATFVSGPSRTSDVEKTLTIGVHGPGQLHIVLLP